MEQNYRSTSQIIEKAQAFISQNKGRYMKNMSAERGDGEAVVLEQVSSREMQYMRLLDIAKSADCETAFLYRDNESSVVLIDLLLRNGVPFRLRKPEMNFFGNRVVKDIMAYLSLALNENDVDSFAQICNKGIIYLEGKQKDYAIKKCKYMSVYSAIESQIPYLKNHLRDVAPNLQNVMTHIAKLNTSEAIALIVKSGYGNHLRKCHLDSGKIEILSILAKQEPEIQKFLNRIKELEILTQAGFNSSENNAVTLSTIHSSKGLEYDSVYMVDVYDGRFPSSRPDIFNRSKDSANGEQEERRLFYVGVTRAKNKLCLFNIKENYSSFIDQFFHNQKPTLMHEYSEQAIPSISLQKVNPSLHSNGYVQNIGRSSAQNTFPVIAPQAIVGMTLMHKNDGEIKITKVERRFNNTIIFVVDSNGKSSSKDWEVLWKNNMIEII